MEPGGRICKENDGNRSADNGFISTRKIRSSGVDWSGSLRNETKYRPIYDKDTAARRVLLDTTNIQQSQPPDGSQITGKWRCPQKRKPHLGPPLKQLRLEQWIRRIRRGTGRNSIAKMTMFNLLLEFNLPISVTVEALAAMMWCDWNCLTEVLLRVPNLRHNQFHLRLLRRRLPEHSNLRLQPTRIWELSSPSRGNTSRWPVPASPS
nr:Dentin sialoprotein [Ipomoea batatas]